MHHNVELYVADFTPIFDGTKKYLITYAAADFNVGDTITIAEVDNHPYGYTGRTKDVTVTFAELRGVPLANQRVYYILSI